MITLFIDFTDEELADWGLAVVMARSRTLLDEMAAQEGFSLMMIESFAYSRLHSAGRMYRTYVERSPAD